MSLSKKTVYGVVAIASFGLWVGSFFLPEKTFFYDDSSEDIERCKEANATDQIRTETFWFASDYFLIADSIDGYENFGVCPYQDYKVKTYGLELVIVAIIFTVGSAVYARKENT